MKTAPKYSPDPWFNSGSEVPNNQIGLVETPSIISPSPSYSIAASSGPITDDIVSSFRQIRTRTCPYGLYTLSADLQHYLFHCGKEPTWVDISTSTQKEFRDQKVGGKVVVPIYQSQTIVIFLIEYYLYETNKERLNILESDYQTFLEGLRKVFKHEGVDSYTISDERNGLVEINDLAATREILTDRKLFDKLFPDDNSL